MSTARPRPGPTGYVDPDDPRFPTSDGEPMADSTTQFRWIVVIKEGLDALFADRPDVFVAGDLLWYVDETDPKRCMAPDAMVVFGRPKGDRRSYKQWFEGVAPQVVFEVHSHTNTRKRMREKRDFYDEHGVEEYYYYDPESGRFQGWLRGDGGLEPIDPALVDGWRSPRLGVTFDVGPGKEALLIRGDDGEAFRTFGQLALDHKAAVRIAEEEKRRSRRARRLAKSETLRADLEAGRADQAERERAQAEREKAEALARAERLAAKLRELGLDES